MFWSTFKHGIAWAERELDLRGQDVDAGRWQGYETGGRPDLVTKEILNLQLDVPVYRSHFTSPDQTTLDDKNLLQLQEEIQPNLPWADEHFAERVSRVPSNPGESYKNWPWWRGQEAETNALLDRYAQEHLGFKFSHTYQERFWPIRAGEDERKFNQAMSGATNISSPLMEGIRYRYGDLDDVVGHLLRNPMSRQATFPIFFPEDTGAVHGGRVPCTLHYHFLLRGGLLHMWYAIRSCDMIRHFRDDLYMACKLLLWVLEELQRNEGPMGYEDERHFTDPPTGVWDGVKPGTLYFTAYSFHAHHGDLAMRRNSGQ